MEELNIKTIKKKYLKEKKSDKLLKGCFHKEDYKKYELWEKLASEKGYAYITLEITKGRWVTVKTIKVDEIRALRGTAFFIYDKHIIFEYNQEDNIRIGVDLIQQPYEFEYYNYPQNVSYTDLVEIVEGLLEYHYDDIYHLWMSQYDVDLFADKLDLNLTSRLKLHNIYLEFCQKQYNRKYGFDNPLFNKKMNELKTDPQYFIGVKKYNKYMMEDGLLLDDTDNVKK